MSGLSKQRAANTDLLIRDGDAARTTVFLHGIGGRAFSFEGLFAGWPDARLIAWDAPGYGNSTPLASEWPLAADYADRLAEVAGALGLRSFDLVGHSLGGLVAVAFAAKYPHHVRRLALMCPALGYRAARGAPLPEQAAQRIADFTALGAEGMAQARASRLVHGPDEKPAVVEKVRDAMASLGLEGYTQATRMLASGDLLADIPLIAAPALLLTGKEDLITPEKGSLRALAALNGRAAGTSESHSVANSGHAVYLEAPGEVTRVITTFLRAA